MNWSKEIAEIERRRRLAQAQGGEEALQRHHRQGKLSIRERIDLLLDADSFHEFGQMAGGAELDEQLELAEFTPANYVLGFGRIDRRPVVVGGEDFTLKGGSPNAAGLRKSIYADHAALQYRVPLVRLLEGGGGSVAGDSDPRKPRTVGSPLHELPRMQVFADAMASVPIAAAALGAVAGFPAGRLVASHFSVMTRETAQVMVGGPALVERALGQTLDKRALGGAAVHASSGVIDNLADDEIDAFAQIRRFLSYLPESVWSLAPRRAASDPPGRTEAELAGLVPRERDQAFDMRRVLALVMDAASVFELGRDYAPGMITALARLAGQPVGIIANDSHYAAGAMTAQGAQKMRRFVELCDTFHLPVVNFVDNPGFMIGPEAEAAGTIRYGMAAIFAAMHASVPWAAVMVRKSYGVAQGAHYGPHCYRLAWPSAESGPLPLEGGVAVAFRRTIAEADDPAAKRHELEARLARTRSPYPAAESFAVHELIDPAETRPYLCRWIEWIQPTLATLTGPVKFSMRP